VFILCRLQGRYTRIRKIKRWRNKKGTNRNKRDKIKKRKNVRDSFVKYRGTYWES